MYHNWLFPLLPVKIYDEKVVFSCIKATFPECLFASPAF